MDLIEGYISKDQLRVFVQDQRTEPRGAWENEYHFDMGYNDCLLDLVREFDL